EVAGVGDDSRGQRQTGHNVLVVRAVGIHLDHTTNALPSHVEMRAHLGDSSRAGEVAIILGHRYRTRILTVHIREEDTDVARIVADHRPTAWCERDAQGTYVEMRVREVVRERRETETGSDTVSRQVQQRRQPAVLQRLQPQAERPALPRTGSHAAPKSR